MPLIVAAALTVLSLTSCHTRKTAGTTTQQQTTSTTGPQAASDLSQRLDAITAATGGWTTMKSGGNLSISGGASFSSGMQVRMVRDQALYISLRPLLGIEAGRLVIRGDSLYVINKLQKLYIAEKVSLLTAGIPATVGMMQDMFLGRPFVMGEGSVNPSRKNLVALSPSGNHYLLAPKRQPKDFTYAFTCDDLGHIVSLVVTLAQGGTAYSMNYNGVQRTVAGNIAHSLAFATDIKGKAFRLELNYDRITWNEDVDTSFTIPAGYKRVDGRSMLGMFGQ